jgi:hypothetical protein
MKINGINIRNCGFMEIDKYNSLFYHTTATEPFVALVYYLEKKAKDGAVIGNTVMIDARLLANIDYPDTYINESIKRGIDSIHRKEKP